MTIRKLARHTLFAAAAILGGSCGTFTPAMAQAETCRTGTSPGGTCTCDLRTLKPLQGAVGLGEVAKKTKDIRDNPTKEKNDLANDPIKVVRGPNQDFYVIDHHHGARAWLDAGYTMGTCKYVEAVHTLDASKFWAEMGERKWLRLVDQNGAPIANTALPQTLGQEPDDPYRTLAWMLRKADGYCRSQMKPSPPPFAEFIWADRMRAHPRLFDPAKVALATAPSLWQLQPGETAKQMRARRTAAQQAMIAGAYAWATSPSGVGMPGFQGTRGLIKEGCNPKSLGE